MTETGKVEQGSWDADWAANRERKQTLGLSATPAERLAWLEEAIQFAYRAGALPRPREELDE
ncbi:MAG TPA: hypothetical protein VGI10_19425 [Polyangiaceae bacterium]|jgi:hypothetical protein